jgi:hypothetical protein
MGPAKLQESVAVNPLLADKPAATGQQPGSSSPAATENGASPTPENGAAPTQSPYGAMQPPPDPERACKSCGAQLAPGQEWCLQCGAGVPGSLRRETDWRPLAVLATAGAILLAGAGTAAYAALNQSPSKPPTHVLIAQVPAPTATTPPAGSTLGTPSATPGTTTPGTTTPGTGGASGTGGAFGTGTHSSTGLPATTVRPPRLPAVVPIPKAANPITPSTGTPTTPETTAPVSTTPVKTPTTGATEPTANPILLDTDAASTYNPSGYPASYFGDPGLAIDGETGTSWTAQVEPKVAPLMAAGLALDLKTPHHLGTLEVDTTTPGMTVEVFGANANTLPATITDPAWKKLTASHTIKKKTATIKLGTGGKAYRFIVLWLTKAPESAVGTATAPGHVSIGEIVPYPPAS